MANCFKPKTVANIDDFTILVRCGAVQSAIEIAPCRSPILLTAVFRINDSNVNITLVNPFPPLFNLPPPPPQVNIDGNARGVDGVNNPDGPNGDSVEAYLDV